MWVDNTDFEQLTAMLSDKNEIFSQASIEALRVVKERVPPAIVQAIEEMLKDPEPRTRKAALSALRQLRKLVSDDGLRSIRNIR